MHEEMHKLAHIAVYRQRPISRMSCKIFDDVKYLQIVSTFNVTSFSVLEDKVPK